MSTYEVSGLVQPCAGYESDSLDFINESRSVGACSLLKGAIGTDIPSEHTYYAFECIARKPENDSNGLAEKRAEYRAKIGRDFPPIYRVRITVEAEEASPEEQAAYWAKVMRQSEEMEALMADHYEEMAERREARRKEARRRVAQPKDNTRSAPGGTPIPHTDAQKDGAA